MNTSAGIMIWLGFCGRFPPERGVGAILMAQIHIDSLVLRPNDAAIS